MLQAKAYRNPRSGSDRSKSQQPNVKKDYGVGSQGYFAENADTKIRRADSEEKGKILLLNCTMYICSTP